VLADSALVLTSLIAVGGTLAGAGLTYLFGQLTARRAERVARGERLRQELIAAYAGFAGAVTELRQAVISRWLSQQRDPHGPETGAAWIEADRRGAAADQARFTLRLLTEDSELLDLADAVFEPIGALGDAADLAELKAHEVRCQELLTEFVRVAGRQVR
jgi:hypothetical protein